MRNALHRAGHGLAWLWIAGFLALGSAPALAVPDQQSLDLGHKLEQLNARLAEDATATLSAADLIAASGLGPLVSHDASAARTPPGSNTAPPEAIEVQRLNMRLALTMLSQAYGAVDNADILAAQPGAEVDALVIRKGQVTLAGLRQILQDNRLQRMTADGPLVLTVPLVIWSGAALELRPGEALHISRPDGAFIVNFGHLDIEGATIASVGEAAATNADFIPFVTTADGGSVRVQDSQITGLGFGNTLKFAGFSVMQSSLRAPGHESWIAGTTFRDLQSVAVSATSDITLQGNHFRDSRGEALIVSRSRRAHVLANLFSGTMPTNAIVLEDGSADGLVAGNIVLGGDRAGIVVRNGSTRASVAHNIVWHRDGGGITLAKSDCGQIFANVVIDNGQKGIEVRASPAAEVRMNTVLGNHSVGIWVSAQAKGDQTALRGNVLASNGSGLAAAAGERILLDGNDFSAQFPQFLSGDLAQQSMLIARDLHGATPFVMTAAGRADVVPVASPCAE